MEAGLPQTNFVRVHRSFIIAIDKIKSIQNNAIILEGDIEVPIGKNYKDPISNLLSKKKF
jgi:DNA-binding LytR/AlgR family response regulator